MEARHDSDSAADRGPLRAAQLTLLAGPAGAGQDDPELLEILAGFDEPAREPAGNEEPPPPQDHRRLGGHLKLGLSAAFAHAAPEPGATDWRRLSRLAPELQLEARLQPAEHWRLQLAGRVRYDLSDAVELTAGVVLYRSGERPGFTGIGDNDRLFLDLVYRF